ncbi:unnamed protein product [Trifolium pratense]|uniref:Uncharacterized protein n=1 Tax=Trifolium pratense TaxID=57577 RepID=A0ACB0IV61_TRIPR|nr:unnamed protein product [Trifolium pratense]
MRNKEATLLCEVEGVDKEITSPCFWFEILSPCFNYKNRYLSQETLRFGGLKEEPSSFYCCAGVTSRVE